MQFKAIFFDLDGTLVDIRGPLYEAAMQSFAETGEQPSFTAEDFVEMLSSEGIFLGLPQNVRPAYMRSLMNHLMGGERPLSVLPHALETLVELKRRGYATGVITSRPGEPDGLARMLDAAGLGPYLDQILTQRTATMASLDKTASLKHAAQRAGLAPSQCVYVGDEPRDAMAAERASYGAAVAVATGAATFELLRDHPEFRPDFVIRSMAELLDVIDRSKPTVR